MTKYQNLGGKSGIVAFEIGENHITVEFLRGNERFYKYTNSSVGSIHLEKMKELAQSGTGLNSYINLNSEVKSGYESKW